MNCFHYADNSCLVYRQRDIKIIDTKLNNYFLSVCDWFDDNKLSIHFGEDKTKHILSDTKKELNKHYLKNTTQLSILVAH